MNPAETDWKATAIRNGNMARFWRDLATSYNQQLQALKNAPENDRAKRIQYTDRTGDTAAARADKELRR